MMKSLDATNTQYSGVLRRIQNLAVLRSLLGDVNVYRLPHLGMLLRADAIQHGALKMTSVFKSTLKCSSRSALASVREMADVIFGISGFLKSHLPSQFSTLHPEASPQWYMFSESGPSSQPSSSWMQGTRPGKIQTNKEPHETATLDRRAAGGLLMTSMHVVDRAVIWTVT